MGLLRLEDIRKTNDGAGYVFSTAEGLPVFTTDKKLNDEEGLKWKLGLSLSSGCKVGCEYCFTKNLAFYKKLSVEEIVEQADFIAKLPGNEPSSFDQVKVELKEMGDPLLNRKNTIDAIRTIHEKYGFMHVVSTSAPYNPKFFEDLKTARDEGIPIRLQFSCHTTSDEDRKKLSPNLRMMTFKEISDAIGYWHDPAREESRATLNFVPMEGFELDGEKVCRNFDPEKVFIKISYLDINDVNKKNGIQNAEDLKVNSFIGTLERKGFCYAHRNRRF